jgi:hypothetical protein
MTGFFYVFTSRAEHSVFHTDYSFSDLLSMLIIKYPGRKDVIPIKAIKG